MYLCRTDERPACSGRSLSRCSTMDRRGINLVSGDHSTNYRTLVIISIISGSASNAMPDAMSSIISAGIPAQLPRSRSRDLFLTVNLLFRILRVRNDCKALPEIIWLSLFSCKSLFRTSVLRMLLEACVVARGLRIDFQRGSKGAKGLR